MALRAPAWTTGLAGRMRELGSYAAVVLILPGGSVIALSWWMLRHRTWFAARARRVFSALLAFGAGLILSR